MKRFKSLSKMKKGLLVSAFVALFTFGFVNTADAKFLGRSRGCSDCVVGVRGCQNYFHFF